MREPYAAIVGAGRTNFGEHWDESAEKLIIEAGLNALTSVEKGISRKDIQAFYVGSLLLGRTTNITTVGAYLSRELSMDVPVVSFTTSSTALFNAVRSEFDVVVVGGIEKMTDAFVNIQELLTSTIDHFEGDAGFNPTAIYATMMNRYLHDFGAKREAFAKVSVKNHHHAANNTFAQFRNKVTLERVLGSALVADPLRAMEVAPSSDGAAAVVITKPEIAKKFTDNPIYIIGSGQATDHISLYSREALTEMRSTRVAAERTFKGLGLKPTDVQIAETHDATTVEEVLFLEDAGFAKKSEGWKVVDSSIDSVQNSKHLPYKLGNGHELIVNCGGGLKADGNPIGATGVRQIYELFTQLRGQAKERQVSLDKDLTTGLAYESEGSGSVSTIHILQRDLK